MDYSEKQKKILQLLLLGEKTFKELKRLGYNDMTLSRKLKQLEENKLISHNHLARTYKITQKGEDVFNEQDNELKGEIFTYRVFNDISLLIRSYIFFDKRISDESYKTLVELLDQQMDRGSPQGVNKKTKDELSKTFLQKAAEVFEKENIKNTDNMDLRDEFFNRLSMYIGQAMIYISFKGLKDGEHKALALLNTLPYKLSKEIQENEIPQTQISRWLVRCRAKLLLELYYQESKRITPEKYKQFVDQAGLEFNEILSEKS